MVLGYFFLLSAGELTKYVSKTALNLNPPARPFTCKRVYKCVLLCVSGFNTFFTTFFVLLFFTSAVTVTLPLGGVVGESHVCSVFR